MKMKLTEADSLEGSAHTARSEDQLIQYVQETTNSAPEQQSKNPVFNHHILKVFEEL